MGDHLSIAVDLGDSLGSHISGGELPRRSVGADSFRRLTLLLKKPATAASPNIPDLPIAAVVPPVIIALAQSAVTEEKKQPEVEASVAPRPLLLAEEPEPPEPEAVAEVPAIKIAELEVTEELILAAEPAPLPLPLPLPMRIEIAAEPVLVAAEVVVPAEPAVPEPEVRTEMAPAQPAPEEKVDPAPLNAASHLTPTKRLQHNRKIQDDFTQLPDQERLSRATPALAMSPEQEAEKTELARSLLDMMASSAGGGQPQERALAADTLLRMLPQLPVKMRATLAQRLAMMEAPPPFLVSRLIGEQDLSIAGPLLEDCSHISDEDLFAVIAKADSATCRLLARRRKISQPIAEALAQSNDGSVLLTLVRNQGAAIPQEGFAALATRVEAFPDLLAPLCTRSDLPVHFAFELFWLAPAQLRRYLLSRFLTDSEMLTKILKITMGAEAESAEPAPMLDLAAVGHAMEQVMSDEREIGVRSLASAGKINVATVERILSDTQGEPLMALLKSIGVPRSEIEKALPAMARGNAALIDPLRDLDEVQSVFDQLSFNKARILLTYWDWASTHSGPYARPH